MTFQFERFATFKSECISSLLLLLREEGYHLVGPTVRDEAIVYDVLEEDSQLPIGWQDRQEPGLYRLEKKPTGRYFDYVVGPHTWRRFLHPPVERLWRATRSEKGLELVEEPIDPPKLAFIGVRPCDLAAIAIQDRVFLEGPYADRSYQFHRKDNFIVAVNCARPSKNCFCTSMGTGPNAESGFDIALTELPGGGEPLFVAEVGTEKGGEVLTKIGCRSASEEEIAAAQAVSEKTAKKIKRNLDTTETQSLLNRNFENPRWEATGERCLSCANCTLVCPTCFCTTVEDTTDLGGAHAERWRRWDSCFTGDFSYIHGGSVRVSTKSRYRQWLTHKLGNWIDQFGTSGCVGCGRCITWCPVGIDLTEEIAALRETDAANGKGATPQRS